MRKLRSARRIQFALAFLVAAAPALADEAVTVGVIGSFSDAPLFVAKERGYFAAVGIDPKLEQMGTMAKMIAPLGAGQIDVAGGAISAGLYNAVDRDIQIRIVADKGRNAPGYGYNALLVRKDLADSGAVKSLADLKGRTVATIGIGTIDSSILDQAMRSVNLTYDDIVQTALPLANHAVALKNKAIDASLTPEPFQTAIVDSGLAVRLAAVDQFYPDQQQSVLLFSEKFIKERREVAQKFMLAYLRGVRDYSDALKDGKLAGKGADEIIAIIIKNTGIKDAALLRRLTPNVVDPDGKLSVDSMQMDWEFLKKRKLITGTVTPTEIIDRSFSEAAVAALGPYKKP